MNMNHKTPTGDLPARYRLWTVFTKKHDCDYHTLFSSQAMGDEADSNKTSLYEVENKRSPSVLEFTEVITL